MIRDADPPAGVSRDEFAALRPLLFAIAYRLLGSAAEAEDIVQDAYLRSRAKPAAEIRSLKAFLTTVVTRLCLDHLKSARVERERYVGPWLPELVPTADAEPAPQRAIEQREAISLAFLVLLERLTPEERAVFVLREAFDFDHAEIATILGKSIPACRQLAHRARQRVAMGRPRFDVSPEEQRRLTERFLLACQRDDLRVLADALAEDVTIWTDGGPKARAARRPVQGRDAVARFVLGLLNKNPGRHATIQDANGAPALFVWDGDALAGVTAIDAGADRIRELRTVVNPANLAYLRRRIGADAGLTT